MPSSPLFIALRLPAQLQQAALLQKPGTEPRAALPSAGLTGRAGGQPCEPEAGRQLPVVALDRLASAPATQRGQRVGSVSHTEPTNSPSPNGSARRALPYITRPLQTGSKVERLALPACLLTNTTPSVLQRLPALAVPLSVPPAHGSPPARGCGHPGSSDHRLASMASTALQANYEIAAPN